MSLDCRSRLAFSIGCFAILSIVAFAEEPVQNAAPEAPTTWRRSTGNDDFDRVLEVRTNDFGGVYEVGQPIPVAIEVRNLGPQGDENLHAAVDLHPYLDVWVRSASGKVLLEKRFDLPIENRITIKKGETFVALLDVREVLDLKLTGEYRISVGHDSFLFPNMGDWTGTLASHERLVRIQAKADPK